MIRKTNVAAPLVAGALATLLARVALRVEDGQFTREYSRLYTALVLSVGGLLLLLVAVLLWRAVRALTA